MKTLKILGIGDTVGTPGREALRRIVPRLRKEQGVGFVVCNGENLAGGAGITEETAREAFEAEVDILTSGDHYFDKREAVDYLARERRVLRPLNYPTGAPGFGSALVTMPDGTKVGVLNALGKVFINLLDSPFEMVRAEVERLRKFTPIIVLDMHAEATSEKIAMGWYLDGLVSLIFGSHTHVQTADEAILPKGTAYISDAGMTGPYRSVLGRDIQSVLNRFLTSVPQRFPVASEDVRLCGVIAEIDVASGRALSVRRVQERLDGAR